MTAAAPGLWAQQYLQAGRRKAREGKGGRGTGSRLPAADEQRRALLGEVRRMQMQWLLLEGMRR